MEEPRLYTRTVFLLQTRPAQLTLYAISQKTGLPLGWLNMLSQGRILNPSVNKIERLYNFLNSKDLEV